MTPSLDSANAATEQNLLAAELLQDGETILLAMKPSGWFVVLASWPVLVTAGLIAAVMILLGELFGTGTIQRPVLLLCAAAGSGRMILACFEWVGRLYVLTDKRVMRIRGVLRVDVFSCPLRQVRDVTLLANAVERILGVGHLYFDISDETSGGTTWRCLPRPAAVKEEVLRVLHRRR